MDPTRSRPCDAQTFSDDHNLTYEQLFATRVNNLLEQRRNIHKRALLDQLTRLRQLVVSATPTAQFSRTHHAALVEEPRERSFDTSFSMAQPHGKTLLHGRRAAVRNNSSSSVVTACSTSAANYETPNSSNQSSLHSGPKPERPPHTKVSALPLQQPQDPSGATFNDTSASLSSSLEINIKRLPALNEVVSAYRFISAMNKNYISTAPPSFSVTCAAKEFSATAQHPLDPNSTFPNRYRNFHYNPLEIPPQRFSSLPNSLNVRSADRFSAASLHGRHYTPPLLARLFFEQELELLFDSQRCHTYSTERESLAKATDLYIQQLLPAQHSSSVSNVASGTSQFNSPRISTTTNPVCCRDDSAKTSSASSSVLFLPSEVNFPHDSKSFQRRTFYRSMNRAAELRAPTAAWCDDKTRAGNRLVCIPAVQSHHAYAVSSELRGLPSYINLQGVRSGQGNASVTLTFGFQRRTNYPFRRTYGQSHTVESFSAPLRILPRISPEFASRVPVSGLSSTLLHLFQPGVHRGRFFSRAQDGSSLDLESAHMRRTTLYCINAEGRLVQEQAQ